MFSLQKISLKSKRNYCISYAKLIKKKFLFRCLKLQIPCVAQLAKQAFELAFTPRNILSGLRRTGICPLNPNVLSDNDFAPYAIADQPPSAFTSNLNSSRMELAEESLLGKGMDELNNACEHHIIVLKLLKEKG